MVYYTVISQWHGLLYSHTSMTWSIIQSYLYDMVYYTVIPLFDMVYYSMNITYIQHDVTSSEYKSDHELHFRDAIMSTMASKITGVLSVCSSTDQRKHQSSTLLAFVKGIQRWPVDSPHKGLVTLKMFSFDDVTMRKGHSVSGPYRWAQTPSHKPWVWEELWKVF